MTPIEIAGILGGLAALNYGTFRWSLNGMRRDINEIKERLRKIENEQSRQSGLRG